LNSLKEFQVKKSDLHAGVWGGSRDVRHVDAVIDVLVRHGYMRLLLTEKREGPGRKPSPIYEIHPSVFSGSVSDNSNYSEN
jgi:hypothetical protein